MPQSELHRPPTYTEAYPNPRLRFLPFDSFPVQTMDNSADTALIGMAFHHAGVFPMDLAEELLLLPVGFNE